MGLAWRGEGWGGSVVTLYVLVLNQLFSQERERRSPAFNLHLTAFPENNESALQLFCHQEGIKVVARFVDDCGIVRRSGTG